MSTAGWITVPCIRLRQPIGAFYIAAIPSRDLVEVSFVDRRRIENDEREVETVSGIQRPLNPKRVAELQRYVTFIDACFPTGVILAVDSDNAIYSSKSNTMMIRRGSDVAKIIDGQHRIQGLVNYEGPPFEINVTIFVNMEMEDQALVFSTINLKQTPVAGSLVLDLFDYAKTRSPQKTCHNIARLLNSEEGSPFFGRIMILGLATGKPNETLTQAAFIDPLLKLICSTPQEAMDDRDKLKRGGKLDLIEEGRVRTRKLVFRNMFIREEDPRIAKVLWNYFTAVAVRWPEAWNVKQKGLILNRTTGYRALMQFLPLVILSMNVLDKVPEVRAFADIFAKVRLDDADFTPETFKPGSGGQAALRRKLQLDTRIDDDSIWKTAPATKPAATNRAT